MSTHNESQYGIELTDVSKPSSLKSNERCEDSSKKTKAGGSKRKLKKLGLCLAFFTVALIVAIVIGIKIARDERYPTFDHLSYTLKNTYQGEAFFEHFDYFTG